MSRPARDSVERPARRQRAPQDASVHHAQPQAEQRIAVPNSIGAAALAGPVGAYEAGAVAGALSGAAGVQGLGPLEGNASAQRLMRYAEHGAVGQKISMSRLQALISASSGSPIPEAVRSRLEQALGHDFSGVRVHTGGAASQAAEGISAHAFTVGRDIFFNAGEFDPTSASGLELLAHELTHVVQHDEGRLPTPTGNESGISDPSDTTEVEAVQTARNALPALTAPATPEVASEVASDVGVLDQASGSVTPSAPAPTAPGSSAPIHRRAQTPPAVSDEDIALDSEEEEEGALTEEQRRQIEELEEAGERAEPPQEEEQEEAQEAPQEQQEESPDEDGGQALPAAQEEGPSLGNPSPGGGGGASESSADAGGSAGSLPALDEVVDYYMETHWDSSDYYAKLDELDLSQHVGNVVDRLTPPQTSQGARSAIQLAYAINTGIIDAAVIGSLKAIPGVGSLFHIGTFVKDLTNTVNDYGESGVNDSFGLWVNIIRNAADVVGSVVGNIGDLATVVEDVAALFAWTGVGAAIAGIVAAAATYGDLIGGVCDTIKLACSSASLINNVMCANEAEANGEFRKAAQFRQLAHGDAINVVVDGIALLSTAVSAFSANVVPGEIGEDVAEAVGQVGKSSKQTVEQFMQRGALGSLLSVGKDGSVDGAKTAGKLLERSKGGGLLTLSQSYDNLMYRMGLGDAMRLAPDGLLGGNYIDPSEVSGSGQAAGVLSSARQASIAHFQQVGEDLQGAPDPKWTQKIINNTINPPDQGGFTGFINTIFSPTKLMEAQFMLLGELVQGADNLVGEGGAGALEGLASTLETVAGPALDAIQDGLEKYKPALDQLLVELTDALVEQQNILQGLRDGLSAVDEFLEQVSTFTDAGGQVEQFLTGTAERLSGLKQTKESLGIPGWVPEVAYRWALRAWNTAVDLVLRGLRGAATSVLPQIDAFVDEQTARGQAYLERMQEAIAEGGEVESIIQGAYDQFAETAASLAQAFDNWEPNLRDDIPAAVQFLRDRANATRDLTFDNRWERFLQFLRGEAQSQVQAWKEEHGSKVEAMYTAEIPQGEIDAVQRAYDLIDARITELSSESPEWGTDFGGRYRYRALLAYTFAMAVARSGRTGEPTLTEFWSHADDLAEVGSAVGA